jgi:hypothetical protein
MSKWIDLIIDVGSHFMLKIVALLMVSVLLSVPLITAIETGLR